MVDVGFKSRVANFVPLSLLRRIAALDAESDPPDDIAYIGKEGVTAVKGPSFNIRVRPKLTPTYAFCARDRDGAVHARPSECAARGRERVEDGPFTGGARRMG